MLCAGANLRFLLSRTASLRRLSPRGRRPRGPTLFSFNGGVRPIRGMGADLFATEPVFREAIECAAPVVREVTGFDVLPAFREGVPAPTKPDGAVLLILLQLGQVELWRDRGVEPDATIGLCPGEIGAIYAAGGLTLEDAARAVAAFCEGVREGCAPHAVFVIEAERSATVALCEDSPVPLAIAGAFSPEEACLLCAADDAAAAASHIEARHQVISRSEIERANHTSLAPRAAPTIGRHVADINPLPTVVPCFFASLGGELPRGTVLDAGHWGFLADSRFRYDEAADAALALRPATIVQIGAHAYTSPHLARAARRHGVTPHIVENGLGQPAAAAG